MPLWRETRDCHNPLARILQVVRCRPRLPQCSLCDVQFERGNFDEASKAFMGVALLYDDPAITPRALKKAATAYQRAGKTAEADKVVKQLRERYPKDAGG